MSDRERSRDRDSSRDAGRGRDREPERGRESSRERSSGRGDDSRRGGAGFSYQRRSAEQVNKRASMGSKDFDTYLRDDIKMWSPNDGQNTIRILPPTWENPEHYGIDVWVHFRIGPDEQSYLCLHKMKGEECPICNEREKARRDGESEEYIKDLEPKRRVLFYMVDRDSEKDGVQAWSSPWTMDRDITKISVDRKTGDVYPIDDPEDGFDVEFEKTGKNLTTKYLAVAIARRESSLGDKKWLQFAVDNPLPSILEYYSFDHIEKAFGGGGAHKTRSDRDDPPKRDDRDDRSRGRDDSKERDDDRGRGRREPAKAEPEFTWEGIHAMTGAELDDLVEAEKLDSIDVNKAENDEELADWICEDLKISKPAAGRRETSRDRDPPKEEESHRDRLSKMREGRR